MYRSRLFVLSTILVLALSAGPAQLSAAPQPVAQAAAQDFEGFDEFVTSVMAEWKVPGLAIAVIKDGEVILSKGYGYRDTEEQLPVTPQTLFAIGSISKSFTATVLGTLADQGKIRTGGSFATRSIEVVGGRWTFYETETESCP